MLLASGKSEKNEKKIKIGEFNCIYEINTISQNVLILGEEFRKTNEFDILIDNKLISLNINKLDTSSVHNMNSMFRDCELLTSLDLSHLDTSLVTDMLYMFSNCNSLRELKIEFNTEKVLYMNSMFNSCSQFKELNICSFNTQFCNNFDNMFDGCKLEL